MGRLAFAILLALAMARAAATAPVLDSVDFALDAFRRGHFYELDATLDRFAKDDVHMNTGERATDVLIARLEQMLAADETLVPQLEHWRKTSKRRPWAELGQAAREQALAWRARDARSVSPAAWPAFSAHLESAEAALARALKIAPGAREPQNALLAFAREVARREPDNPYLALLVVRAHQEIVSSDESKERLYYRAPAVWAEVSGATAKFLARYPDSPYGHNLLARLALLGGKREVLRRELAWIGEAGDLGIWRDEGEFMRARTWAALDPVNHLTASLPASRTP
jgi:hypothetical protein